MAKKTTKVDPGLVYCYDIKGFIKKLLEFLQEIDNDGIGPLQAYKINVRSGKPTPGLMRRASALGLKGAAIAPARRGARKK